jgi:hypothetical protein
MDDVDISVLEEIAEAVFATKDDSDDAPPTRLDDNGNTTTLSS